LTVTGTYLSLGGAFPPQSLFWKAELTTSIGNRLENYSPGALQNLHLVGNRVITLFFDVAYGTDLKDILSGYRAFTLESVRELELNKTGFEIETRNFCRVYS